LAGWLFRLDLQPSIMASEQARALCGYFPMVAVRAFEVVLSPDPKRFVWPSEDISLEAWGY